METVEGTGKKMEKEVAVCDCRVSWVRDKNDEKDGKSFIIMS